MTLDDAANDKVMLISRLLHCFTNSTRQGRDDHDNVDNDGSEDRHGRIKYVCPAVLFLLRLMLRCTIMNCGDKAKHLKPSKPRILHYGSFYEVYYRGCFKPISVL